MFNKHTFKYSLGIILLTSFFVIIGLLLYGHLGSNFCLKYFLYLLLLFVLTNIIFHFFLIYNFEKRPKKFIQVYLLFTVAKILVYLTFLIVYIFKIYSGMKCFLVSFLVQYLGYTFYEVIMLSRFLKNRETK